ncbi:RidA family protein [Bacillus sp. 31A1R]|uniref:RidA family protein n=1 Tax=Robertmurraya mangrovi TaxID=3098077 RepID=A0ABU5J122_9BACI|nr:RidA family protein [Bacillus sp. 31A1R]MDZ5473094.1 RidA family protein [Bacillus sp. 31A1R]
MTNKITFIHSNKLAAVDYAYASRVPSDTDILYMAGSCPLNKEGEILFEDNYKQQAKLCVDNLRVALNECGATLENVVYTRVLVASHEQSDLVEAWNAIREEFGDHNVPSTLSGVTVLGYKNQLVEIEAIAAVEKQN